MPTLSRLQTLVATGVLFFFTLWVQPVVAQQTIQKRNSFVSIQSGYGKVFQTSPFVSGDMAIPRLNTFNVKYGKNAPYGSWESQVYGMPYYGIGVSLVNFNRADNLGKPFSIYLLQGATIAKLDRHLILNYEWNLGAAFNWVPYNAFTNPNNTTIGSTVNIHISGGLYFSWAFTKAMDLNIGGYLTHFSNGSATQPNAGINMVSGTCELVYNFGDVNRERGLSQHLEIPEYEPYIQQDLLINITGRQIEFDTLGTGLPSPYTNYRFKVLAANYVLLFSPTNRYKWGGGAKLVYDESAGARSWREKNPLDGKLYDRVQLDRLPRRFAFGGFLQGEMNFSRYYSAFAQIGYNVIQSNSRDPRFFQTLGVKAYVSERIFGTFGIRAYHFSQAQFLFLGLGYTWK